MQLGEKLLLVTTRLCYGLVRGLVLIGMQKEAIVRYQRLGPYAANVVAATRDDRIRDGAAWHEAADLPPRQARHSSRMIQVHEAVFD